ncbi:hypothetical protein HYQ46_006573 [Verticillium longisporum]|nr:hypothetical protein HYQ46_006573 [Verticillium longisporum]
MCRGEYKLRVVGAFVNEVAGRSGSHRHAPNKHIPSNDLYCPLIHESLRLCGDDNNPRPFSIMAPKHMVFDGVAIFWTAFASLWTALLVGGMAFLWTRRDMPILRIRGLPLSFGAVVCLHLYWIACQLGTSYGHLMPNGVEFWIMGIYLPFGIALFHASNSRFLHVAKAQMKYAQTQHDDCCLRWHDVPVFLDACHVSRLLQIPPFLWCGRHRGHWHP